MAFFRDITFWFSATGVIVPLVRQWNPDSGLLTEKDFERSLLQHLQAELDGYKITPQFKLGRNSIDIMIERKCGIELKHNLDDPTEFARLKGQIDTYLDWGISVIVVLTGTTAPDIRVDLYRYAARRNAATFSPTLFSDDDLVTVIEKKPSPSLR